MSLSKFDSVWRLISKYQFEIHSVKDFTCVLCHHLMTDACTSLCGCQYCYRCICNYIGNSSNKYCPGENSECKEDYLVFDRNVYRNLIINKKISKIKVTCPNQSCNCCMELIEMENHLRMCTKQPIECPYVAIGCTNNIADKEAILTHVQYDVLENAQLSIESTKNLKIEVNELRNELVNLKLEVKSLTEESKNKDRMMIMLEEKLLLAMIKIEKELKEELKKKEDYRLLVDKDNVITTVNDDYKDVRDESKINQDEFLTLEQQLNNVMNDIEMKVKNAVKERENDFNEERLKIECALENVTKMTNEMRADIDEIKSDRHRFGGEREMRLDRWIKLYPNINADFIWRIDELSKKKNTDIFSDSFHHNNYKLCLYLWIDSCTDYTYLYCDIMKGDKDDDIEWPMRRAVTLKVIDQYSLRTHKSETFQSDFTRPTDDSGASVGGVIIDCLSIEDHSSIIVEDSLLVSCFISPSDC